MALEALTIGASNASVDPKIKTNFETLSGLLGGSNKVADTGMESPNNSAYRLIHQAIGGTTKEQVAGTYLFTGLGVIGSGGNPATETVGFSYFYFDDADYTVAGKTQKLRLRAQVGVNATKPTIKFTFGLYPVTVAGGANEFKMTLGTVVSGSTVELSEPAASTVSQGNSGDFTIPADSAYCIGVVTSGTLTANSMVKLSAQLQTHST